MTAHIEPQLPGAGFDELTRDLEDLSAQYQGLELAETPRLSTDAAIKAAAARALRPQPEPSLSAAELVLARRRRMHRWRVPIALAALLVLCASAGLVLWREQHSTLLAARDVPAPAAHDAHTTQGVLTAELGPQDSRSASRAAPMSAVPRMAAPKMTVPKAMQPLRPALAPAQPASFAASPANDSTQPPGSVSPNDAPIIAQTRQNFARTLSPPADSGYAAASQDEATRPLAILPGANRRPALVVGAVTTVAPPRGSPQALLVTALVAAINADDLQATRDILDALHQQYPDIRFTETFVTRVRQLGLDPHQ